LKEIKGKQVNDVIDPDKKLAEYGGSRILAGETVVFDNIVRYRKDGSPINVMHKGIPLIIDGKIVGGYVIYTDISERALAEEKLRNSEEKFRNIFDSSSDAIIIFDLDENILEVNNVMCQRLGYERDEMLQMTIRDIRAFGYIDLVPKQIKDIEKQGFDIFETFHATKDGGVIPVEANVKVINYEGKPALLGIVRDISKRKKAEEKLKYLSFHDILTNLYNRAYFEEELIRLNTDRQLPLSLIMGDLNGLKLANDAFGHDHGDMLLKKIADILKQSCRDGDIICRWGGDEFGIILPSTTEADAKKVADRIKINCSSSSEGSMFLSISLGTATKTEQSQDIKWVLKKAEDNMYRAKLREGEAARKDILSSLHQLLAQTTFETGEHNRRMEVLALKLGTDIGLSKGELQKLSLLASLHDIGKATITPELIMKPERLAIDEWKLMKEHSEAGFRIAQCIPEFGHVANEILAHHEHWNGQGYPKGLKGEKIPLLSRIITIVDAYEAMSNDRPYRVALSNAEVLLKLQAGAGTQFDSKLLEMFIYNTIKQIS
ncbi:MAG: diguanylate cyclase, partial [Bacillota bacterium]|nr:diguanylate cyclase [Bacillota bacterium]